MTPEQVKSLFVLLRRLALEFVWWTERQFGLREQTVVQKSMEK